MSRILYQGIQGAYQYLAAKKFFSSKDEFFGAASFAQVFSEITAGNYDYGLVAIENNLAGSVVQNYELLNKYEVSIIGEIYLKIDHCLLTKSKEIQNLRKVFAHPMALAQCEVFLNKYPQIEKVEFSDNASAAKYVSESGNSSSCAIASVECSDLYNLGVLARKIQDQQNNWTRFIIFRKGKYETGFGEDKTKISISFSLDHSPGSLVKFLNIFSNSGFNLTKIESRPIKGRNFEYMFSVDAEFLDSSKESIEEFIEVLGLSSLNLKVLGIYPSSSFDKSQ